MAILLATLSIGNKAYFSCSSCNYSITAFCFNTGFVLWTFVRCFREMILLSTSWRIFLFHFANSSVVILGYIETIRSMLELNQSLFLFCVYSILLTLLHENWDLYLQVFWIYNLLLFYSDPLKHGHTYHRQNLYVTDNHILLCLCRILYRHLCQWKIQSLLWSRVIFPIVLLRLYRAEGGSSIVELRFM